MRALQIRAVAFREGDVWVVQGVEYDIVAQTEDPADAPEAFARAVISTILVNRKLGRDGLEKINAAPDRFREMFEQAHTELRRIDGVEPPEDIEPPDLDLRLYRQEAA